MNTLILKAAKGILDEARIYLEKIPNDAYCMELTVFSGATIGQHTRHFIELFQCLVDALLVGNADNEVVLDYGLRQRNQLLQTEPKHALAAIDAIQSALPKLPWGQVIMLKHTDYATGLFSLLPTSFERELSYNIEHTIHHFALIKIGLKLVAPGLTLPPNFGVAPSTTYHSSSVGKGVGLTVESQQ